MGLRRTIFEFQHVSQEKKREVLAVSRWTVVTALLCWDLIRINSKRPTEYKIAEMIRNACITCGTAFIAAEFYASREIKRATHDILSSYQSHAALSQL